MLQRISRRLPSAQASLNSSAMPPTAPITLDASSGMSHQFLVRRAGDGLQGVGVFQGDK